MKNSNEKAPRKTRTQRLALGIKILFEEIHTYIHTALIFDRDSKFGAVQSQGLDIDPTIKTVLGMLHTDTGLLWGPDR